METIKKAIEMFIKPGYGWGSGSGKGWGWGSGEGSGWGEGSGEGSGKGEGSGWGEGSGEGSGKGSGYGYGVKNFCGNTVYKIDRVPTLIDRVHGNIARGRILNRDLTVTPCYIAKGNGYFAHGETLRDAMNALEEKILDDMPVEEKIQEFIKKFRPFSVYNAKDFYNWHHTLTGSCEMGRKEFARDHDIDIEADMMTPEKFMDLTKDAFGGSVIRQLMEAWKEKYKNT